MQKLEFQVKDVEPEAAEPVEVELGGRSFVAHCPNDYEFITLVGDIRKLEMDPTSLDIRPILGAFFDPPEVSRIDASLRGGAKARISLVGELMPCLLALVAHYQQAVITRLDETQKRMTAPKAA